MLCSDKILPMKTLHCMSWLSSMLDLEFYRLYNGVRARDLMPCLCRDFAVIFAIFTKVCRVFLPFLPWFSTVPKSYYRTVIGNHNASYRMVSLSMTLSDPWHGFQGYGSFKRRISPKRRIDRSDYTVSQIKRGHFIFRHNFYSCLAILKIFEARNFAHFSASTDVQ